MPPLALQNRGEEPVVVCLENQICLISACLGARRRAFDRAGFFDPATQRVKDGVGSTEDYDWELKVWNNGGQGVYVPDVICYCEVPTSRMKRAYHRRWHLGHGKFNALACRPEFERGRRAFGIPLFLYRQVMESLAAIPGYLLKGNDHKAFEREAHVCFCIGFIWQRWTGRRAGEKKPEVRYVSSASPLHPAMLTSDNQESRPSEPRAA
jgi:GT2 family glycosyltransferase